MDIQITTSEDRKLWKGCFFFSIHCNKWKTVALLLELEKTIKLRKHSPFRDLKGEAKEKTDDGFFFAVRFNDVDTRYKDFSGSVKKFVKDYEILFVTANILGASVRCVSVDNDTTKVSYFQRKINHLVRLKDDDDLGDPPTD